MARKSLKERYPNLQTDEDYEYLKRELRKQRISKWITIALAIPGLSLFLTRNHTCWIIAIAFGLAAFVFQFLSQRKIDEEFIAQAAKPLMNDANLIDQTLLINVIRKKSQRTVFTILFYGIAWLLFWGIYELFYANRPLTASAIIFCLFPILIGAAGIGILLWFKKKRIHDIQQYNFIVHRCPVSKKYESSDADSTTYQLDFQTRDYGKFTHSVSKHVFLRTSSARDSYFLILLPKRKKGKYKLLTAYASDEYLLADDMPIQQTE